MQTKDQILKNWKVMATASTVAALGITGVAMASPGNDQPATPPAIEIADQRGVDVSLITSTDRPTFEIVPGPTYGPFGDDSIESMDSLDSNDSIESMDSLDSNDSIESMDSLDSDDSVDSTTYVDSLDSDDSVDSTTYVDSLDSDDSLDSVDSMDSDDSLDSD
ncbi:MAG TPA: hypothetical protein VLA29_06820 [Acidimicrobiia bacterium]|nr:hypothetical protein [Acidimicrobiia bacterium]